MKKKYVAIIRNLLLVFTFVSIGFAVGKRFGGSGGAETETETGKNGTTAVKVYYMHSAFRCTTCNNIESMTKDLLNRRFSRELESGEIVFVEADFQQNTALARRFEVVASCVVTAAENDGEIIAFQRLDEVWTLMRDSRAFDKYLIDSIESMRGKLSERRGK